MEPFIQPRKIDLNSTQFTDYIEYTASLWVLRLCCPLLIIFGTFGNLLSLLVLLRKRLRSSPTMFFLSVLAVVDILVLYSGLLRVWMESVYDINIREMSDGMCRFHTFFVYFILSYSVWIIVAVTVDRCMIVCAPFKAKSLSSLSKARKTVLVIAIILLCFNAHLLFTQTLVPVDYLKGGIRCSHAENSKDFRDYIWPWMDFCVYCIIPFTVMIVCNSLIIRRITLSARKLKQHANTDKMEPCHQITGENILKIHTVERLSVLALDVSKATLVNPEHMNQEVHDGETGFSFLPKVVANISRKSQNRSTSLTFMLLVVSFVFMILVLPITAYLIGFQVWIATADPRTEATLELGWAVVNILQYTNNSIHFFLYCLTGPRFRRELVSMFKKKIEPSDALDKKASKA